MNRKFVAIAILLCSTSTAAVAGPSEADTPEQQIAAFCEASIKAGEFRLDEKTFRWSQVLKLNVANLPQMMLEQNALVNSTYGPPRSCELVREYRLGTKVWRATYVVSHDHMPTLWHFNFFKGADGWQLIEFKFNDQIGVADFDNPYSPNERPTEVPQTDEAPVATQAV